MKAGSKQQLSQEARNTAKSIPNSAFPSLAVEGITELQLTQVTRRQPVEISLSVSTFSLFPHGMKGRKKQFVH